MFPDFKPLNLLELLHQKRAFCEKPSQIKFHNGASRNIWVVVFEASVHEQVCVNCPNGVSETLQRVEFLPFAAFCFVDFKLKILAYRIRSASQHNHQSADEIRRMLITSNRFLRSCLVRGLDPVPSAISVSAKTPSILERTLISTAATKGYHHTGSGASSAKS